MKILYFSDYQNEEPKKTNWHLEVQHNRNDLYQDFWQKLHNKARVAVKTTKWLLFNFSLQLKMIDVSEWQRQDAIFSL